MSMLKWLVNEINVYILPNIVEQQISSNTVMNSALNVLKLLSYSYVDSNSPPLQICVYFNSKPHEIINYEI